MKLKLLLISRNFFFAEIEDEDDWATSDEAADDDNDENAGEWNILREIEFMILFQGFFFFLVVVAESALDRMACGLGGKTVFPHILRLTPQMLQQADWKFRHAGKYIGGRGFESGWGQNNFFTFF